MRTHRNHFSILEVWIKMKWQHLVLGDIVRMLRVVSVPYSPYPYNLGMKSKTKGNERY